MTMTLKPKPKYPNWGDKRKIETGAVGDTKKHVLSVLHLRGVTLKGTV